MTRNGVIGLVAPLPPQTGGVASFARWLVESAPELGVEFRPFDLYRRSDSVVGGALRTASPGLQARQLARFVGWSRKAPAVVHYCVSLTATGLPRDLLFVAILRVFRRRVVAHVHGPGEGGRRLRWRQRPLVELLGRLSARKIAVLPLKGWEFVPNPLTLQPASVPERSPAVVVRVVAVGAVGGAKGSDVLVRALAKARDGGAPISLTFVGQELQPGAEADLRRLAADLGVAAAVDLVGVLDTDGVAAAYSEADIFCLPSLREGLPMALLEAMAFGLPVVSTPVGAIPLLVEDGRSGLLVEVGSAESLVSALRRLAGDATLRRELGNAAARRVHAVCDPEIVASAWRRIYREAE